ncbi:MAG: hypothetical protein KME10_02480 [Plectolyngbya sp. WJT66-NPBG17]|jgi:hypothetical protein|nr:hypothetical protein [Plectolyngbya sp. WJT66-NPBG17]
MLKVLKATYHDGKFELEEQLGSEWEGKTVEITIKSDEVSETEQGRKARVEQFLEKWKQHPGTELTEDYKFDRDEIYDR